MKTNLRLMGLLFCLIFTLACGKDEPQDSGITVSSNKTISAYTTDMCTQYTGETCIFVGGQRVMYSDGSVLITGSWNFLYTNGSDTDTNENTVTIWVPSSSNVTYQLLSNYVARGSGYKKMMLVYERSPETIKLFHDTSGDGKCCSGDTEITSLTLQDI